MKIERSIGGTALYLQVLAVYLISLTNIGFDLNGMHERNMWGIVLIVSHVVLALLLVISLFFPLLHRSMRYSMVFLLMLGGGLFVFVAVTMGLQKRHYDGLLIALVVGNMPIIFGLLGAMNHWSSQMTPFYVQEGEFVV